MMKVKFKKRVIEIDEIPKSLSAFKSILEEMTGVPEDRQKLLCRKAWKGDLKRVEDLKRDLTIMLIGSSTREKKKKVMSGRIENNVKRLNEKQIKRICVEGGWNEDNKTKILVAKGKVTYECILAPKSTYYDLKVLLQKHVPERPAPLEQRIIQSGKTRDDTEIIISGKRAILMFQKRFHDKKALEEKVKSAKSKLQEVSTFVLSLQSKFEHRISDTASMTIDLGVAEDRIEIVSSMIPNASSEASLLKKKVSELSEIVMDLRRRALLVVRRR